ncbi:MAG: hypothetical protein ACLFUJ_07880 [Phycisphaerae bacterium]
MTDQRDRRYENQAEAEENQPAAIENPDELPSPDQLPELRIYTHSTLFYWWPVWVAGLVMATLTYIYGQTLVLEGETHYLHHSRDLGIIFATIFFLVVLITNITLRGIASLAVVLVILLIAVTFAWLGWWDNVLGLYPHLTLYATAGFYLVLSVLIFVAWALMFFVFDRFAYWVVRPGQLYHTKIIGESERTYDTRGMIVEKMSEDWFRHRMLGLGSGDIRMLTSGARNEEIVLPNVLRADKRIDAIHRLINVAPDDLLDQQQTD